MISLLFLAGFIAASENREYYEQKLIQNPNDSVSWYNRGVVAFKENNLDTAQESFSTALENKALLTREQEEHVHYNLGNTYAKQKEYKAALEQYEAVVTLNPDNKEAEKKRAYLQELLKKQEENQNSEQEPRDQEKETNDKSPKSPEDRRDEQKNGEQEREHEQKQEPQQQKGENKKTKPEDRKENSDNDRQNGESKGDTQNTQKKRKEEREQNNHEDPLEQDDTSKTDLLNNNKKNLVSEQEKNLNKRDKDLLAALQEHDAHAQKELMKVMIAETAGNHGQKNW